MEFEGIDDDAEIWFICKICYRKFSDPRAYAAHKKIDHGGGASPHIKKEIDPEVDKKISDSPSTTKFSFLHKAIQDMAKLQEIKLEPQPQIKIEKSDANTKGRSKKMMECGICHDRAQKGDDMISCTSCTIVVHSDCIPLNQISTVGQNEPFFCDGCILDNQEAEFNDSPEMFALHNIKKRKRTNEIMEPAPVPKKVIKTEPVQVKSEESSDTSAKTTYSYFQCDVCFKAFLHLENVMNHLYVHDGQVPGSDLHGSKKTISSDSPDLLCPLCDMLLENNSQMLAHFSAHEQEYQLIKAEASAAFNNGNDNKDQIQKPIKNKNRNKRTPAQCPWCERTFSCKPYLKEHMGIHTGEKGLTCKHCSKAFRFGSTLSVHIKKTHSSI